MGAVYPAGLWGKGPGDYQVCPEKGKACMGFG